MLKKLTNAEDALKKLEEDPVTVKEGKLQADGVYNVANVELAEGYRMFNVIACELTVKDGKMTAVITLHGTGLDYMYAGKAKKAEKADKSDWIPHKLNEEGQFTFEVPVKKLDTVIVYSARSKRYAEMAEAGETVTAPIWYDKGLIFHSDSITRIDDAENGSSKDKEAGDTKKNGNSGSGKDTEKNSSRSTEKNNTSGSGTGKTGGGSAGSSTGGSSGTGYTANTDGSTGAVDSSTGLADGTYSPDSFTWSGGTGRLSISCSQITISGGKAYATLVFSSGKIVYVKADGGQLGPVAQDDGSSTYEVPVQLNANNTILACTTAMSQPHEVEYTIYVGLEAAKKAAASKSGSSGSGSGTAGSSKGAASGGSSAENDAGAEESRTITTDSGLTLSVEEDHPSIPGADYIGTLVTRYAKKYRLHFYESDIRLIEVTLSDDERPDWNAKNASGADDTQGTDDGSSSGTGSSAASAGDEEGSGEEERSLYENSVLQYLLVPEDAQLPAGIDKEMIVVHMPVKNAYLDSVTAQKIVEKIGAGSQVTAVSGNSSAEGEAEGRNNTGSAANVIGHMGRNAYKELLKSGTDLAVISAKQLLASANEENEEEETIDSTSQAVQKYGDMLALLEIPMLADRSDDETEELGRYEWLLLYGSLFNAEKEAQSAFTAAEQALNPDQEKQPVSQTSDGQETGEDPDHSEGGEQSDHA